MKYYTDNIYVVRTNGSLNLKGKRQDPCYSILKKKLYIYIYVHPPHHTQETSPNPNGGQSF